MAYPEHATQPQTEESRMDSLAIFTVFLRQCGSNDIYRRGIQRVHVFEHDVKATEVSFDMHPNGVDDVMILKIPMRYVTIISDTGDKDAIKD